MNGHEFKTDCPCHPVVDGDVVKHNTQGESK